MTLVNWARIGFFSCLSHRITLGVPRPRLKIENVGPIIRRVFLVLEPPTRLSCWADLVSNYGINTLTADWGLMARA